MSTAIILFAHGSRNLAWRQPFERIVEKIKLKAPHIRVELAFLELMSPRLPHVLNNLAVEKISQITIVPLFFGLGNHVANDLRALIDQLIEEYPNIEIQVAAPLGESEAVLDAMTHYAIEQIM